MPLHVSPPLQIGLVFSQHDGIESYATGNGSMGKPGISGCKHAERAGGSCFCSIYIYLCICQEQIN